MPRKKTKSKTSEKSIPLSVSEPAVGYMVTPRKKILKPLTDDDWALPGRPATDEEMEKLAQEMENEGPGEDIEIVFNRVKKGLKKSV